MLLQTITYFSYSPYLSTSGAKMPTFAEDAIEAVSSLSHGGQVIDLLCVNCLLLGAQAKKGAYNHIII